MFNLRILNFLQSFGFRKAETTTPLILPSDWPSDLHSKCSNPDCWYPNLPQAVAGQYNCLGHPSNGQCRGVYEVTPSIASAMIADYYSKRKIELYHEKLKFIEEKRERESQTQRRNNGNLEKKPSRPSTLSRISQKALKECRSFRSLEYRKEKCLPGIPGLSERKINRRPIHPPQPVPPIPAQTQTLSRNEPRTEVRVHCYFPKELERPEIRPPPPPPPDFLVTYRKAEYYTPARTGTTQAVPPRRTRNLSRDLGFTSDSRSSLSVYSQTTNYR